MECYLCKLPPDKDERREAVQCDSCKKCICSSCAGMSASEVRVLQLKGARVLKYMCKECIDISQQLKTFENVMQGEIKNMHKIIDELNKKIMNQNGLIIDLLKEIKGYSENKTSQQSYANVVKNASEVLVVKPKEKQESVKTKSDLKEAINPKTLAIAVENIKEGKEGAVIISCSNTSTKEKIKEKVENELGTQYKVTDGTLKNPKVIIRGVEEELLEVTDQCIIDMVKKQNELEFENTKCIQVVSKYRQKNKINKGNIIMTVTPELKSKMCHLGRINIGWRRCIVQEFFTVVRCFKCARYGHISSKCENEITCFKCAGLHKTSDCVSESPKCINCVETIISLKNH